MEKLESSWLQGSQVYQLFVGRTPQANIVEHPGEVLLRLASQDWNRLVNECGFNLVYLLGIFDNRSPIVVWEEEGEILDLESQNRVPSPFAIRDHCAVSPRLGSRDDLRALIDVIHQAGAHVMVDFVGNHTALNHPWTIEHPDYYVRNCCGLKTEFSGDVVKLNYEHPEVVKRQLEVLFSAVEMGVDAFRCDMAHIVPNSFWEQALTEVHKIRPDVAFIGEAYTTSVYDWSAIENLISLGFDACYHEFLYRNMRFVFVEQAPIDYLVAHLNFVLSYKYRSNLMHYVANHDDPMPPEMAPMQEGLMALLSCLPGTTFCYNGQLNNLTRRLKHHSLDILSEEQSDFVSTPKWMSKLTEMRHQHRPLIKSISHNGNGYIICQVALTQGEGSLHVNLSSGQIGLSEERPNLKGMLHGLISGEILGVGQAELLIEPPQESVNPEKRSWSDTRLPQLSPEVA